MNQANTKIGEDLDLELDNRVHSAVRDRLSELMDTYNARTLRFSDGHSLAAGRLASDLEAKIQNLPPTESTLESDFSFIKEGFDPWAYLSNEMSAQRIGDKVLEELFDRYDVQPGNLDSTVGEVSLDLVSDVVTDIKDNVLGNLVRMDALKGLDGYAVIAKMEENFAENSFDNLLAATYMQVEKEPKLRSEIRASLENQVFNRYSGDIYTAVENRLDDLRGPPGWMGEGEGFGKNRLEVELRNRIDAVSLELGSDKRGKGISDGVELSERMYAGMSPMTTRGVSLLVNDAIVEKSLANNDKLVELSDGDIRQLVLEAVENNYESALNNLARNSFLFNISEADTLDIIVRNGRGSDYKSLRGMAYERATMENGPSLLSGKAVENLSGLLEHTARKLDIQMANWDEVQDSADAKDTVNRLVNEEFDEAASKSRYGGVIPRDSVNELLERVLFASEPIKDCSELAACVLEEVKKYNDEHQNVRILGVPHNFVWGNDLVHGFNTVVDMELNKVRGNGPRGLGEDEVFLNNLSEIMAARAENSVVEERGKFYSDDPISYFDELVESAVGDILHDSFLSKDGVINRDGIEYLRDKCISFAENMKNDRYELVVCIAGAVDGVGRGLEAGWNKHAGDFNSYELGLLSDGFKAIVNDELTVRKGNEHNKEGEKGGGMKPEDIFRAEIKKQAGEFSVAYAGKSGKDKAGENMPDDAKFGYNNTVFKNHIAVIGDMGEDAGFRRSAAGTYVTNTSYDIGVEKRSLDVAVEAFSKLPEDLKQEVVGYVNELKQEKNEFKSENKLSDAFKELVEVAEAFNPHFDIPESQPKTDRRDPAAVGKWIEHLVDALPEEWKEARRSSVNDFDEHFSENLGYLNNQVEEAYDWLSGGEIGGGEALDILAKASFDTGFAGSYVASELQDLCVTGGKSQEYYKLVDDCGQYLKNLSADASFKPAKVAFVDSRVLGQLQVVGKWVDHVAAVELDTMKDKGVENTYSFRHDKDYAEKQVQSAKQTLEQKGHGGAYNASLTLARASIHTGFDGVTLANDLRNAFAADPAINNLRKFESYADNCHMAVKYSLPGKNVTVNHENTNTNHPFPKRGDENYTPPGIARTNIPEGHYKGSADLKNLAETLNVPIGSNLGKVIAISDVAPRGVANGVAVDIAAVGCRLDLSNAHSTVVGQSDLDKNAPVYRFSDDKSPLFSVMKYADAKGNEEYGVSVAESVKGDVKWKEVMQKQREEFAVVLPVLDKGGKPVIDPETGKAELKQKIKDGKPEVGVVLTDSDKPLRFKSPELALEFGSKLTSDKAYTALYQDKDYVKAKAAGPEKAAEVKQDRSTLKIDITD